LDSSRPGEISGVPTEDASFKPLSRIGFIATAAGKPGTFTLKTSFKPLSRIGFIATREVINSKKRLVYVSNLFRELDSSRRRVWRICSLPAQVSNLFRELDSSRLMPLFTLTPADF